MTFPMWASRVAVSVLQSQTGVALIVAFVVFRFRVGTMLVGANV
jgi:hypothetical protein